MQDIHCQRNQMLIMLKNTYHLPPPPPATSHHHPPNVVHLISLSNDTLINFLQDRLFSLIAAYTLAYNITIGINQYPQELITLIHLKAIII